ncbi:MAG: TolC family protein [Candidatus Methylacidiphilales bacterium]
MNTEPSADHVQATLPKANPPLERPRLGELAIVACCVVFALSSVLQSFARLDPNGTLRADFLSRVTPGSASTPLPAPTVDTATPPPSRTVSTSSSAPASATSASRDPSRLKASAATSAPSNRARITTVAFGPPTPGGTSGAPTRGSRLNVDDGMIGPEVPELAMSRSQGDGQSSDANNTGSTSGDAGPSSTATSVPGATAPSAPSDGALPDAPPVPGQDQFTPTLGNNFQPGASTDGLSQSGGGGSVARNIPPRVRTISPLASMGREAGALDLQQCFRLAAIRSDTLKISYEDIVAAQARTSQAIAALYPTIRFNSNHTFVDTSGQNNGSVVTFDPASVGGPSAPTSFDTSSFGLGNTGQNDYVMSTTLSMSLPIFNGLRNINEIGAAKAGTEANRQSLRRSYQTLYGDVANAFYQVLTSEGDLIVLKDQVASLEARVRELQDRVQLGRSRPSELLQSRADLASTKVNIEQVKGTLAAARELMAFYIGIPANSFALRETQRFPGSRTLESYLRTTGQRPDILQRVAAERQARHNLSAAKGSLWPTINVTSDITLVAEPETNQDWTVGLTISLPIFDGGLITSQIRERKALLRQSALNVEQLMRQADQDIRAAFVNFSASAAQVLQLREYVELSGLSFDAQAGDYKLGIVSNLDVLNALRTFHDARRQYHDADMTGRLNLIKLHVAAGTSATSMSEINSVEGRDSNGAPISDHALRATPVPGDGTSASSRAVPIATPVVIITRGGSTSKSPATGSSTITNTGDKVKSSTVSVSTAKGGKDKDKDSDGAKGRKTGTGSTPAKSPKKKTGTATTES